MTTDQVGYSLLNLSEKFPVSNYGSDVDVDTVTDSKDDTDMLMFL